MLSFILDILSVPAVLIGLVSMIGLIAQKKSLSDILKGSIKTIMGVLILGGGAGLAVGALTHFGMMFQFGFGINGVVPHNEAIVGMALKEYGTQTALIMAFGMVANILIARFTPLKFIFLTGHHTLYMACMIGIILTVGGLQGTMLVAVGAVLLGFVMALFPAIAHPTMKKITGSDDVAFGHFSTATCSRHGSARSSATGKRRRRTSIFRRASRSCATPRSPSLSSCSFSSSSSPSPAVRSMWRQS